jgi:hypothetical protein
MAQPTSWWRFWNRGRIGTLSRRYRYISSLYLEGLEERILLDGSGPRIISSTPTEVVNGAFDHLDVQFNEPINASSFTMGNARWSSLAT